MIQNRHKINKEQLAFTQDTNDFSHSLTNTLTNTMYLNPESLMQEKGKNTMRSITLEKLLKSNTEDQVDKTK